MSQDYDGLQYADLAGLAGLNVPASQAIPQQLAKQGARGFLARKLAGRGVYVAPGAAEQADLDAENAYRAGLIRAIDAPVVDRVRAAISSIEGGAGKTRTAAGLLETGAAFRTNALAVGVDSNPDRGVLLEALGGFRPDYADPATIRSLVTFYERVKDGKIEDYADLLKAVETPGPRDLQGRPQNVAVIPSDPVAMRDDEFSVTKMTDLLKGVMVHANFGVGDCGTGLRSAFTLGTMLNANQWIYIAGANYQSLRMVLDAVRTYDGTADVALARQYQSHFTKLVDGVILVLSKFDRSNPIHRYWLDVANMLFPGRVIPLPFDLSMADKRPVVLRLLQRETMDAFLRLTAATFEGAAAFEAGQSYHPGGPNLPMAEAVKLVSDANEWLNQLLGGEMPVTPPPARPSMPPPTPEAPPAQPRSWRRTRPAQTGQVPADADSADAEPADPDLAGLSGDRTDALPPQLVLLGQEPSRDDATDDRRDPAAAPRIRWRRRPVQPAPPALPDTEVPVAKEPAIDTDGAAEPAVGASHLDQILHRRYAAASITAPPFTAAAPDDGEHTTSNGDGAPPDGYHSWTV